MVLFEKKEAKTKGKKDPFFEIHSQPYVFSSYRGFLNLAVVINYIFYKLQEEKIKKRMHREVR